MKIADIILNYVYSHDRALVRSELFHGEIPPGSYQKRTFIKKEVLDHN